MLLQAANDHGQIAVPATAYSLPGFRRWVDSPEFPEFGRVTYHQGRIFLDMSPERADSHNQVKSEICRVLGNLVRDQDRGRLFQDGMWMTHDVADLSNEADGMFVSWESFESGRIRLVANTDDGDGIEMRGAPDWVLEVVSKSSEEKDKGWLKKAYHQAEVAEYWLVDARGESIDFSIMRWRPQGFEQVPIDVEGWRPSPVFRCEVKLTRAKDRIGGWRYTLATR